MINPIYSTIIDLFDINETHNDIKLSHIFNKNYGEACLNEKYITEAGPLWIGGEALNQYTREESISDRCLYITNSITYPKFYGK